MRIRNLRRNVKPLGWRREPDQVVRQCRVKMMMKLPQPIRADTLRSQVAGILRDAIFSGKLLPGQSIREMPLARRLQVSQATVREALAELEQMGLVVRVPNKGTRVTNLSVQEVQDRLKIRLALEELALTEASQRMTEEDFAELTRQAKRISDAIRANSYLDVSQTDVDFHRYIWERAGSPVLFRTLDQLATPLFAFMGLVRKRASDDQTKTKPHEDLIEALRSRDAERIRATVREHIEDPYREFLRSSVEDLQALVANAE